MNFWVSTLLFVIITLHILSKFIAVYLYTYYVCAPVGLFYTYIYYERVQLPLHDEAQHKNEENSDEEINLLVYPEPKISQIFPSIPHPSPAHFLLSFASYSIRKESIYGRSPKPC